MESKRDQRIGLDLADEISKVLQTLSNREEKVVRMRFGIGEKAQHTIEEVAREFEVSEQEIRRIEARALRKLRDPSRAKGVGADYVRSVVDAAGSEKREGPGPRRGEGD